VRVFIVVKFIFAHKILQGNIDERVQYARYEEGPLRILKIDEQVSYQNLLYVTILNLFRSGFKTSPQAQFRCWSKSRLGAGLEICIIFLWFLGTSLSV